VRTSAVSHDRKGAVCLSRAGQPFFLVNPNSHFDPTTQLVLNPKAWVDAPLGQWEPRWLIYDNFRWQRQPSESVGCGWYILRSSSSKSAHVAELFTSSRQPLTWRRRPLTRKRKKRKENLAAPGRSEPDPTRVGFCRVHIKRGEPDKTPCSLHRESTPTFI
jgi:hypothetical protein